MKVALLLYTFLLLAMSCGNENHDHYAFTLFRSQSQTIPEDQVSKTKINRSFAGTKPGTFEFDETQRYTVNEEVTFNMKDSASWLELEIWKRNPKRIQIKKINLLFCDSIPNGLNAFSNATELYVYKSKNLKGISVLKSIHTLHLRNYMGKITPELDKLEALTTLKLTQTRIDSFLCNTCKQRIEHLFAYHSKIGIPFKELNEWRQLKTLVIKGSQNKNFSNLSDIDMLSFPNMTTLKIVGYYHNFKGIPSHLEQNRPANCLITHKGMTGKEKIKVRSLKAGLYSR